MEIKDELANGPRCNQVRDSVGIVKVHSHGLMHEEIGVYWIT